MARRIAWFLLPLAWATACGGRFEQKDNQPQAGATSRGGASPSGTSGGASPAGASRGGASPGGTSGGASPGGASRGACETQQQSYHTFRAQLFDEYEASAQCKLSSDCTIYYDDKCGVSACGLVIAKAGVLALDRSLFDYAQTECTPDCPSLPEPPCRTPTTPVCFEGYCQ